MRSILIALGTATALAFTPVTHGQGSPDAHHYFDAKHVLGVGAAYQKADAELRASVKNLPEVSVDLDQLGVEDSYTSWALEYRWRFAPKWVLVGLAYTFDEDGERSVERDFNFDGKEFKAGAVVDTSLRIDTYVLDVLYRAYHSERAEILVGGGLHAFDIDASISGRAFVGEIEREDSAGTSDLLAPLPNLRAQAFYALNAHWGLNLTLGWLSAEYDDYDGSFAYAHPRIGYWPGRHWAFTLGYQYVDVDLTYEKSSNREQALDATFSGPTFFVKYRF